MYLQPFIFLASKDQLSRSIDSLRDCERRRLTVVLEAGELQAGTKREGSKESGIV